ncbi:MAG: hypothetical protein KH354_00570 [Clostridiales bacterium]|nr:hypothetical protein [Clostridiales bacterium]
MAHSYGISVTPNGLRTVSPLLHKFDFLSHIEVKFALADDPRLKLSETIAALRGEFPRLTFSFYACPQLNLCEQMPSVRKAWLEEAEKLTELCRHERGLFIVLPCGMLWGEGNLPDRRVRALSLLADSLEALCAHSGKYMILLENTALSPSAGFMPLGNSDDFSFLLDAVWNNRLGFCVRPTRGFSVPVSEIGCMRTVLPLTEDIEMLLTQITRSERTVPVILEHTALPKALEAFAVYLQNK